MKNRKNTKRSVRIKYLLHIHNKYPRNLPMVNVVLLHNNNLITTTALVDSGDTSTFILLCLLYITQNPIIETFIF